MKEPRNKNNNDCPPPQSPQSPQTPTTIEGEVEREVGKALFETTKVENDDDAVFQSFADQFLDKVRAIHEYFDKDKDGYLNFVELSNLQLCTSGNRMDGNTYAMVCKTLGCPPNQGVNLEQLKFTYAAEGTDIEDDFRKVFGHTKGKKERKQQDTGSASVIDAVNEENVIEVGEGVVDISPS